MAVYMFCGMPVDRNSVLPRKQKWPSWICAARSQTGPDQRRTHAMWYHFDKIFCHTNLPKVIEEQGDAEVCTRKLWHDGL